MTQKICDRCGEIINDNTQCCNILPMYKIIKMDSQIIDLCCECAHQLGEWLKEDGEYR